MCRSEVRVPLRANYVEDNATSEVEYKNSMISPHNEALNAKKTNHTKIPKQRIATSSVKDRMNVSAALSIRNLFKNERAVRHAYK